ncbi:MAG: hypothetical protein KIT80_22005 [Chitinophagaceae bacterium]|nr:hypothetical protein [Chitinophagaceae bacterium]MCW5929610.1 hypothetical protein [Chitinophagaceae bacterium]
MAKLYKYLLLLTFLFSCTRTLSQEPEKDRDPVHEDADILKTSFLVIRDVIITGNKITRPYIISREVPVKKGNQYPISAILSSLPESRQNLINTGLFLDATVDFDKWVNDSIDIVIDVKERWYYFPVPYFKPVDRNFNVWIKDYNASLGRVNYGLKFIANNVSGRNDKLNIWLLTGYSRQIVLNYNAPNIDNTLKNGMVLDFLFAQNKELNYATDNNKQLFYKNDKEFVTDRLRVGIGYSHRTGYIKRHSVRLSYNIVRINDSVLARNPDFFGNQSKRAAFPDLFYQYQDFDLNYIPYPTKGFMWEVSFNKRGVSKTMNLWEFSGRVGSYWEVAPRYYLSSQTFANLKLPLDQPFYNRALLGYGNLFLRGLENYVVDGTGSLVTKTTFSREIWKLDLKTGLKSRSYGVIPFRFYAKVYGDLGYAYAKKLPGTNLLNNKLLYTGGAGIDIVSIYDAVVSFEYSFNQLGQKGLFLEGRLGF